MSTLEINGNLRKSIADYAFQGMSALPYLNLTGQNLFKIEDNGFMNLSELQTLDLSSNKLTELKSKWFSPLIKLIYLALTDNDILKIDLLFYNVFPTIEFVHASNSELCCLTNRTIVCVLDSIETSPICVPLIPSKVFLVISISLCILIVPANIIVVLLRLTSSKRSANSLTIINLAISDAVQGIYLGLIISNDLLYHEAYGLTKSEWKNSLLCSAIRFLALLCATLSASSAIIIALDRHKIIATPFLSVSEGSGKGTRILIIILTWVLCSIGSYVPFMPYTAHIYQTVLSDICFIHLYDTKYSTYMFVYVNQHYSVAASSLFQ